MASRGGFTGPPMNPSVHPMNVAHAAGMRMPGMPQPPIGYSRSMNTAPQYPQVGFPSSVQAAKPGNVGITVTATLFVLLKEKVQMNFTFVL